MSILIKEQFLSKENCFRYVEFLGRFLKPSPREGMSASLGYPTSYEASLVGEELGVVFENDEPINHEIGALFDLVKAEAELHFKDELDLCQASYQLMTKGSRNPLHADFINLDGSPIQEDGSPEEIEFSGLLYLSEHPTDFEGGLLDFPGLKSTYHPRLGDLLIFRGDIEHRHEVTEVLSGERRNLVFFWGRKGNVSNDKAFFTT